MGRIPVPGQLRQKVPKTLSQQKNAEHGGMHVSSSNSERHKIEGLWSKMAWAKGKTLSPK
jgi:hypothetical protein